VITESATHLAHLKVLLGELEQHVFGARRVVDLCLELLDVYLRVLKLRESVLILSCAAE